MLGKMAKDMPGLQERMAEAAANSSDMVNTTNTDLSITIRYLFNKKRLSFFGIAAASAVVDPKKGRESGFMDDRKQNICLNIYHLLGSSLAIFFSLFFSSIKVPVPSIYLFYC